MKNEKKRLVLVKVTKEDIQSGHIAVLASLSRAYNCPVSVALNRLFPCHRAAVSHTTCWLYGAGGGKEGEWCLPVAVQLWLDAFDQGFSVEPMEFYLQWDK